MPKSKKTSKKFDYTASEKRAYYIGQGIKMGQDGTGKNRFANSSAKIKNSAVNGYNSVKKK